MQRFDRITWNPNQVNGQPCIRGMRLTVRRVVEAVAMYPNRDDLFRNYPELEPLAGVLDGRTAVLDGEIVAITKKGRVSFGSLTHRLGLVDARVIAERAAEIPVTYMIFDVLYLDGRGLMGLPYVERRAILEALELDVRLAPRAARVASKLRLRPNPKVATGGKSLQFDGEGLVLESVALDGNATVRGGTVKLNP